MQRKRRRFEYGRDLAERSGAGGRVFLPAELTDHEVARAEPRIVALDYFSEVHGCDDVPDLE